MRTAIGGAWLYGLVVTFILLFASFLAITINYTKAYRVKNEVIDIIEREEGLTNTAIGLINNYLSHNAQLTKGTCPSDWSGYDLNNTAPAINSGRKHTYCVKKNPIPDSNFPQKAYYELNIFFNFDLPIFGSITNFKIYGETIQIVVSAN